MVQWLHLIRRVERMWRVRRKVTRAMELWEDLRPGPPTAGGVRVVLPRRPGWNPCGLTADLSGETSRFLEDVLGYRCEGTGRHLCGSFNRFGFSALLDPSFPTYNARIGCFVVPDCKQVRHFGFDDLETPDIATLCQLLMATHWTILAGAGCPKPFRFDIHPHAHVTKGRDAAGHSWTETRVRIETWSPLHRGRIPTAQKRFYETYGIVPEGLFPDQENFHPITHVTTLLARYDEAQEVTLVRYYNSAEWQNRGKKLVSTTGHIETVQREIADAIRFSFRRRPADALPSQGAPPTIQFDEDISIAPASDMDLPAAAAIVAEGSEEYVKLFGEDPVLRAQCIAPILRMTGLSGIVVARRGRELVGVLQFLSRRGFWHSRPCRLVYTWLRLLGFRGSLRALLGLVPSFSLFVMRPIRSGELYVALLSVRSDWRRHGIGRLLLAYAQSEAIRNEFRALTLHVAEHNTPARSLYESVGFVTERTQDPWLGHRLGVQGYLLMKKGLLP